MSKVLAIMSLDGSVADRSDRVADMCDWFFGSGDGELNALGGLALCDHSGIRSTLRWTGAAIIKQ